MASRERVGLGGWRSIALHAVALAASYLPPFDDAPWRRAVGVAGGLLLLVLAVGRYRLASAGPPLRTAEEKRRFSLATDGIGSQVLMGVVVVLAWGIGLV